MPQAHFLRCQKGHCAALDEFYGIVPEQRQRTPRATHIAPEKVGTALKSRIENLLHIKTGNGCGCQTLAADMDRWGIAGCEQRREQIVGHLVANRDILTEALESSGRWIASIVSSMAPEAFLRAGANELLSQAIEDARAKPVRRQQRTIGKGKPAFAGPFVPNPEWTSTVRHLTYHIWPTKRHDGWKWNMQQLAKRIDLFNGKRILGIAVSSETESAATVIDFAASLGISFNHVVERPNNKKLREVVTWLPMLELLPPESAGQNEVVFSAHAKGVRHDDPLAEGSTLWKWTDTMYRTCLDDWPEVESQLNRFVAAGCFRRYNNFKTQGNHQWHFSGTFFWWRLAEIGQRNWRKVDQQFFGTESWIGHQCHDSETACLFVDDCGDLYQPKYWADVVQPALEARAT